MNQPLIPGPNNELIPETPFTSSQYPITADFATSASWAGTASYFLGFISSASYASFAATASYLLGSIANAVSASWADMSGHAKTADSASWAATAVTASWSLGSKTAISSSWASSSISASYALSASYSLTASYALQAKTSSYSLTAASASTAGSASYSLSSSYALTASYALNSSGTTITSSYVSGSSATVNLVTLANTGINAYLTSKIATGITTATPVDSFSDLDGNSVKWLISINDGSSFKTSEIIAIWEPVNNITNFAEITTNVIGSIPVAMSVNISGNLVRLIANPASGSWTVKTIRFVL